MTWKISPLLTFEFLGVFVNTLTADENYPFGDSGDSNAIFLKTETFFPFFCYIYGIFIKF